MLNFPISKFPTGAETDASVLYRSLGSFWTQIFQDKAFIKGYTFAQAEQAIQRYYDLMEVISAYSVKDTPVFHKSKWQPIQILKSKFGSTPFVFESGASIFGPQANSDQYYKNVTFQFGFPKRPAAEVFLFNVGDNLKSFGIISDRVFNPSFFLCHGSDVLLTDGVLYFNQNIFDNPSVKKVDVIAEDGTKKQFTDTNGNLVDEQLVILWAYHADLDESILFNNFGYIFELNLNNDQFFKDILKGIFDLFVDGPTIQNIVAVCSAFLGVEPIIETTEVIESVFDDSKYHFVVTDKHVYKFDLTHNLKTNIVKGAVFQAGDTLTQDIQYFDNVITPGWWGSTNVLRPKLALSQHLFLGNYESQFIVSNDVDLVTVNSIGDIVFPIEGTQQDIINFHKQLNANKTEIKAILGLGGPGTSAPIQPVNFLMENFLKTNTVLIKFRFATNKIQSGFLALLPLLRSQLPPYVYIIMDLELVLTSEVYDKLNEAVTIAFDDGDFVLNSDGSNSAGVIENLAPYGYKDARTRLFEISLGIPQQPYEIVGTTTATADSSFNTARTDGRIVTMRDGYLLKTPPSGATTLTFNKLLLLDFYY
jgi:hypothetical protein